MLSKTFLSAITLSVCFFLFNGNSDAVVVGGSGSPGASSKTTGNPAPPTVTRVTGLVKTMNNSMLTLTDGRQYDLSGVNIRSVGKSSGGKRKSVAELVFINGQLTQATIHVY